MFQSPEVSSEAALTYSRVSSQATCGVRKMNLPATADVAYQHVSYATVWTTAATAATRPPVRTAPLVSSPAGPQTPACPEAASATEGPIAETDGMRPRSCVV